MPKIISFIRLTFFSSIVLTSVFSFISIDQDLAKFLLQDKLLHMATFSFITFFAYASKFDVNRFVILLGLIFYGLLIEIIQNYLSYRNFELLDLLYDIFGVLLGYLSWKYLKKIYPSYWFILISPQLNF